MASRLLRGLVLLAYVLSVVTPSLALAADKPNAEEFLRKGDQAVLEGKLGPARQAYERALAAGADFAGDYTRARNLGMIYMNGVPRDFARAARWLQAAWKLRPEADDTRLLLAQALSWSGKHEAAVEHYRALAKKSPDTAEYTLGLANTLYWSGKADEAFAAYDRFLESKPANLTMRLEYARVLSYARRLPQAAGQYQTVLQADPNNVQAQVGLAKIASWQDDFKGALERYNRVLKRYPNLYDAVVGKAYTLYWMGRTEEARELFQHALKRNPRDKEVIATLKEMGTPNQAKPAPKPPVEAAQAEARPSEPKPAEPAAQTATLQPETFETHQKPQARNAITVMMEQAEAASNAGNYAGAVHLYHEVLAKEPANGAARIQLARVLSWSRNFEESAKEYDKLLEAEPNNTQARLERARVLSWGENYEASIEEYRSLIKQAEQAQAQPAPQPPAQQPKPVEVAQQPQPAAQQPKPVEVPQQPAPQQPAAQQPKPVEVAQQPQPAVEQPKPVEVPQQPAPQQPAAQQPKPVEVAQQPAPQPPEPVERAAPDAAAAPAMAIDLTQTRLELARVLAWSKRYSESLAQFNQILPPQQTPEVKDKPILIEKARVLAYSRNYEEAIKTYDVALALDPADLEARLGKGQTLYWWGRLDQAATVLRPLMQVQALSPETKTTTAFTLAAVEHGRGKDAAALTLLNAAANNDDTKQLRNSIREGMRPVLRFSFGWEDDQEEPSQPSTLPTTVTRGLRFSTALSFNVKPDVRMTVSNTVTRGTTSNPLLAQHGTEATAYETEVRLNWRANSWLEMVVGAGEGSVGAGSSCDLQAVSPCLLPAGERTHHFIFDVRPTIRRAGWTVELEAGRHIADWTPLSIHDNVLRMRYGVAASYNWNNRVLFGGDYWHADYTLDSPQLDPAVVTQHYRAAANGGALFFTPTWYRGEHVRIEGGIRWEKFLYDDGAEAILTFLGSGGFFTPREYQRFAGNGRVVYEQQRFRIDVHGTFGPQRVTGFASLLPPPAEWGTTGSVGTELSANFGRFRPFLAYDWFGTATAAGPGQTSGAYKSHSLVAGFSIRF